MAMGIYIVEAIAAILFRGYISAICMYIYMCNNVIIDVFHCTQVKFAELEKSVKAGDKHDRKSVMSRQEVSVSTVFKCVDISFLLYCSYN